MSVALIAIQKCVYIMTIAGFSLCDLLVLGQDFNLHKRTNYKFTDNYINFHIAMKVGAGLPMCYLQ